MSDYIEQVKVSISETVFHSPTAYSYFGNEPPRLAPRVRRAMTPKTARNYLLYQLNLIFITSSTFEEVHLTTFGMIRIAMQMRFLLLRLCLRRMKEAAVTKVDGKFWQRRRIISA